MPHLFRITPDEPDNIAKVRNALSPVGPGGTRTVIDPAIDEVTNREEDTNKILSVTRAVKLTTALLAGLLVIASILLIANTIRLSLYARRREVEVMKLVGATDWFIRWPFVMEGMLVGALGGILAILVLAVFKVAVVDPLAAEYALIAAPETTASRCWSPCCSPPPSACRPPAPGSRCGASCACDGAYRDLTRPRYLGWAHAPPPTLISACVILLPVLLVAGIWLGGHPDNLPDPLRETLVADTDGRVYEEAIDTLERDYYRKVDRKKLLDQSLEQAVGSLDDRFSHYFAPRDFSDFQAATEGRFEGVGMTVEEVERGLRVLSVYEGSPADRGGLEPGDIITHVDGRSIPPARARRSRRRGSGPGGQPGPPDRALGRQGARARPRARRGRDPGGQGGDASIPRPQHRHVHLAGVASGAQRRGRRQRCASS